MTAPKPGTPLRMSDFTDILQALNVRNQRFPDEAPGDSLGVVLFNIGDQYTPVHCVAGEWRGLKQDLPPGRGIPTCPNGHVLLEQRGVKLGWVEDNA